MSTESPPGLERARQRAGIDAEAWAELRAAALRVLEGNRQQGISEWKTERYPEGVPYNFVCPANLSYPFQWFWDSCFHAIVLSHLAPTLAEEELRTLVRAAQPDGFIPHIVFWRRDPERMRHHTIHLRHPYFTSTIQPPVLAAAIERVYRATGNPDFLRETLPPAAAFFRWLGQARDPDGDHLIAIIQPDESGVDASPKYDALMQLDALNNRALVASINRLYDRYEREGLRGDDHRLIAADLFVVEDVLVNAIYADGLERMATLLRELERVGMAALMVGGQEVSCEREAHRCETEAQAVTDALLATCYDADTGLFYDLQTRDERPARINTISSLFPLILRTLPHAVADRMVREHLLNREEYWLPYPVPSVARSEPKFDPDDPHGFIWRGPTWINANWFLAAALRRTGWTEPADHIVRQSVALVRGAGFRECYNPLTGAGQQARDFGWSTLVVDMILGE